MDIGERIKFLRKERNLTAQNLADLIGVTREHVSSMENNKKKPSFPALEKICEVFNISMREFFNDDAATNEHSPEYSKLMYKAKDIPDQFLANINSMIDTISDMLIVKKKINGEDTTYVVDKNIKPNGLTEEEELRAAKLIERRNQILKEQKKEPNK